MSAQRLKPEGGAYLDRGRDGANKMRGIQVLMARSQVSSRDLSGTKTPDLDELINKQSMVNSQA